MYKDSWSFVLQAIKWDLWGFPSKCWKYKNRIWFGEFVCWISVCPQNRNHTQFIFRRIIADSALIFHELFLGIIGNEPSGKYKDPTHHPYHQKIIPVPEETQFSMDNFRKCQNEFIGGFNENNWWAVEIS